MIKRPLLIMFIFLVIGCLMTNISLKISLILIFLVFLVFSSFLIIQNKIPILNFKKSQFSQDKFLLIIPLVMLIGLGLMNRQLKINKMDYTFDEKCNISAVGKIYRIDKKDNSTAIYIKDVSIKSDKIYNSKHIITYVTDNEDNYYIGNKILIKGQLIKFKYPTNVGQFNEYKYYKTKNIDYKIYAENITIIDNSKDILLNLLYNIKLKLFSIYNILLPQKYSGIINAMILGEKSLLQEDINDLFRENGISHILAISGLHISIIGLYIYKILKKTGIHIYISIIISIILIFLYGILTNFSVSTSRAVIMVFLSLLSKIVGKTYDILSAISLSGIIIILQSPLQIYNSGFLLSFLAVLSIAIVVPIFEKMFILENTKYKNIKKGLIASISINIVTLPIILYFYYEFPLYSFILNILIIPLMTLVILLALIGGILGCLSIFIGKYIIAIVYYILCFYEILCKNFIKLPFHSIIIGKPKISIIIMYYLILIIFLIYAKLYNETKNIKEPIWILIFLMIIFIKPKINGIEINILDVGQGDSIVIKTNNNIVYTIDGGSSDIKNVGKYRIEPFLKANGIKQIDYMIITHTDNDHISGLLELLENKYNIKNLVLPYISEKDDKYIYMEELANKNSINIIYIKYKDIIKNNNLKFVCLHPTLNFVPSSVNSYSTVLSLEYENFKMLFTGDLEANGEKEVIERLSRDYDILKVAHHGSKNSTLESFLEIVNPKKCVISCGKNNRYGHPNKELLERIKDKEIFRTDKIGAINIKVKNKEVLIQGYNKKIY